MQPGATARLCGAEWNIQRRGDLLVRHVLEEGQRNPFALLGWQCIHGGVDDATVLLLKCAVLRTRRTVDMAHSGLQSGCAPAVYLDQTCTPDIDY